MIKFTPIIMLHYVSDEMGMNLLEPWNISRASFIRLLDFIEKNNYKTIGFEDAMDNDPTRSIILTFDDCPKHLWDFAIPELIRRRMKAVFYIATAYIDGVDEWNTVPGAPTLKMMDKADIRNLTLAGMEVGSHGHRHIMHERESERSSLQEIKRSKEILEQVTGRPVVSVAYPYGSLPKGYNRRMHEASFRYGCGVFPKYEKRFGLGRLIFSNDICDARLAEQIGKEYVRKKRWNNPAYRTLLGVGRLFQDSYNWTKEGVARIHKSCVIRCFSRKSWYVGLMDLSEIWSDSCLINVCEEVLIL